MKIPNVSGLRVFPLEYAVIGLTLAVMSLTSAVVYLFHLQMQLNDFVRQEYRQEMLNNQKIISENTVALKSLTK